MNTIKYLYLVIIAIVLGTTSLSAQQKQIYNDGILINCHSLEQKGDSLIIDLDINLDSLELSSGRSLTLTPLVEGDGETLALSSILLNGRNRHKVYVRDLSLDKISSDAHYAVVKMTGKQSKIVHYRQSVLFIPWMASARLALAEDLCGCGGHTAESSLDELFAVTPAALPAPPAEYQPQFMYSYVIPVPEKLKRRTELHDVYLNFPVNKVVIYPEYMNNQTELAKTEEMIEKINSDKNLHIQEVVIRGYASPEGSVPSNFRLSEGRAAALKNYLVPRIKGEKLPIRSESGGEDWKGTIKLVEKTDFPGRDALLQNILNGNRSDAAEQALRTIEGGTPYAFMLKEIYPKVRRVVCSVDYTVREFTVEEGRILIHTHPEQLSLLEMYEVANSYPENSDEFIQAMQIAALTYPNDNTALQNAATVSLVTGQTQDAESFLNRVQPSGSAYENTLGILQMLKNNFPEASKHFQKAQEAGSEAALHNLKELHKKTRTTNDKAQ